MANTNENVKTRETAGADEKTPSRSQYFSWINNTNEGATEEHTLINLDYFKWLRDKYGMVLDIYAWDAGNLDGSQGTYQRLDSPKIKAQYPNGYAPVSAKATEMGTKLGVWCGPDGFGDTPEEEAARYEQMVSLCRDHNFGLFKMDAVCSSLREEKRDVFIKMMKECRKYSPDLILLNHRLELGHAEPYATTFLWEGMETYIDVMMTNKKCAPHHREYMFHRGNPDELKRLTEDHGVCISSCIDYFEDELVYQAFGRSMILAPEVYGNPWLMRDDEHAKMARIYNLHRTYRDILTEGVLLPHSYGWHHGTARGNADIRFITVGNPFWEVQSVGINLNAEIGLERTDEELIVSIHHPYEKFVGRYRYDDRVVIDFPPFRALLIEVAKADKSYPMLTNCSYEVLHETNGVPDLVNILEVSGKIGKLVNGVECEAPEALRGVQRFDNREAFPVLLCDRFEPTEVPANVEAMFETSQFAMDNDSLEARSLKRSGETNIPQVKAARDAFFSQRTYKARGPESKAAFDGDPDTFFDGVSESTFSGVMRFKGGSLRVDFGEVYEADAVLIEYFDPFEDTGEIRTQRVIPAGEYSQDLSTWSKTVIDELTKGDEVTVDRVITCVHNIVSCDGVKRRAVYKVDAPIRYLRLPETYHHIYKIALLKDGAELVLKAPRALNLMPHYSKHPVLSVRSAAVSIPSENVCDGSFLSVALNGYHGREGAYVVAELDGKLYGCPDRSVSYSANAWECPVSRADSLYTYYLPIAPEMLGREVKLYLLEMTEEASRVGVEVYLCEPHDAREGIVTEF